MNVSTVQDPDQHTLFPIKNKSAWEFYKLGVNSNWVAEELDLRDDIDDLKKLTPMEVHLVESVLAFFAVSDSVVCEVVEKSLLPLCDDKWEKIFYRWQVYNEGIHWETYSLLLDTYISDRERRAKLFDAIRRIPAIEAKAAWSLKWLEDPSLPYVLRLVANACTEGIFFSPSFNFIYWFKVRNLMPGFAFSNDKIAPDERLHCEFACNAFNTRAGPVLREKHQEAIVEMVKGAVLIEKSFVRYCLPATIHVLDGLKISTNQCELYVEFIADWLMCLLGFPKIYNVENPCSWMATISLPALTNFHERKVAQYGQDGLRQSDDNSTFSTNSWS